MQVTGGAGVSKGVIKEEGKKQIKISANFFVYGIIASLLCSVIAGLVLLKFGHFMVDNNTMFVASVMLFILITIFVVSLAGEEFKKLTSS